MNKKFKTVLIDTADVFEREIEEVLEYYWTNLIMWALVQYENGDVCIIPARALAIKN